MASEEEAHAVRFQLPIQRIIKKKIHSRWNKPVLIVYNARVGECVSTGMPVASAAAAAATASVGGALQVDNQYNGSAVQRVIYTPNTHKLVVATEQQNIQHRK